MKNRRLDEALLDEGYFDSLQTARGWIMSGRVVVDGRTLSQTGYRVKGDACIALRGLRLRYASKGGYKLARGLDRFKIDVSNWHCLDAGASTGGFTDCLLQHGAAFVHAVDVGYGQLRGSLALDSRVRSLERTNIGDVTVDNFRPPIEFACADLSYLSMSAALPQIRALFPTDAHRILFLIKPLYEGLHETQKADVHAIRPILRQLFEMLQKDSFAIRDACASPILGGRGAMEFLAYACKETGDLDSHVPLINAESLTELAIADAISLPIMPIEQFISSM